MERLAPARGRQREVDDPCAVGHGPVEPLDDVRVDAGAVGAQDPHRQDRGAGRQADEAGAVVPCGEHARDARAVPVRVIGVGVAHADEVLAREEVGREVGGVVGHAGVEHGHAHAGAPEGGVPRGGRADLGEPPLVRQQRVRGQRLGVAHPVGLGERDVWPRLELGDGGPRRPPGARREDLDARARQDVDQARAGVGARIRPVGGGGARLEPDEDVTGRRGARRAPAHEERDGEGGAQGHEASKRRQGEVAAAPAARVRDRARS